MSLPGTPCDTFCRTKIKDCNELKALASDGGKCFLKFIKKILALQNKVCYKFMHEMRL